MPANRPHGRRRERFAETDPFLSVAGFDGRPRFSTIREARTAARQYLREHPEEDSVAIIFTLSRRDSR